MSYINRSLILSVFLILLVNLTTPWFYRIINVELITGVILLLLSTIIFLILCKKVSLRLSIIGYSFLLIFTMWFTYRNIDKNLFTSNALETHINKVRQGYYLNRFGPLIHNNYTLYAYKYQRNLFTNINFNQFFFGGEPRFRPNALDFEKYSIFTLPFFLIGIFFLIRDGGKTSKYFSLVVILVLLIVAFANPNFMLGLYPFYPIITALIAFGVYRLIILISFLKNKIYVK